MLHNIAKHVLLCYATISNVALLCYAKIPNEAWLRYATISNEAWLCYVTIVNSPSPFFGSFLPRIRRKGFTGKKIKETLPALCHDGGPAAYPLLPRWPKVSVVSARKSHSLSQLLSTHWHHCVTTPSLLYSLIPARSFMLPNAELCKYPSLTVQPSFTKSMWILRITLSNRCI